MDGEKSNDMFVRFDHSHIISTAHAVFPVTGFRRTATKRKQVLSYCWDGRAMLPKSSCRSLTHSFSALSDNMTINHILQNTRFLGLHFRRRHRQYTSATLTYLAPKLPNLVR